MMNLTMHEFAGLAWTQCWQLTALILVVALLGATLLRTRPHVTHVLWVLVFVKSLTVPLWTSPTGVFGWVNSSAPASAIDATFLVPAPSPLAKATDASRTGPSLGKVEVAKESSAPWAARIVLAIWGVGVCLLLGLAGRRWLDVYRSLSVGSREADPALQHYAHKLAGRFRMKSRARVLVSEANYGPMVFGSYRPLLILPAALVEGRSPQELQPMLAHELLHARRGDTTFGALQFFAQVVWWFHPLVWWASRSANRVCERCCDEEVVANLDCSPREYARCLLDALEMRACLASVPGLPGMRSVDITYNRVENIMKNSQQFQHGLRRRHWIFAIIAALLVLPAGRGALHGSEESPQQQNNSTIDSDAIRELAAQAVAGKEWHVAAEQFRILTQRDATDCRAWFMLGYSLHATGKLDEAIVAHKRATACPRTRPTALYNLACAYALQSKGDQALESLQQAAKAGFISPTPISDDPDFKSLKDHPKFAELAKAMLPISTRDVYRQFDFWVGKWNVFGRNGQQVGTNVITKGEKGFLITEKWTNADGGTGTSINYYDPSDQKWKQTWVDAGGNVIQYEGEFKEGKMQLEGSVARPNGAMESSRVSYSIKPDGTVRQLIKRSRDSGKTWEVYFDGTYRRVATNAATPATVRAIQLN